MEWLDLHATVHISIAPFERFGKLLSREIVDERLIR